MQGDAAAYAGLMEDLVSTQQQVIHYKAKNLALQKALEEALKAWDHAINRVASENNSNNQQDRISLLRTQYLGGE